MSFSPCEGPCVAIMVADLAFFYAPWFNPDKVRRFLVAGCSDGAGILPDPLPSCHLQYLEW